jgi:nonsense-mediated mRNA decay protein 3
MICTLCGREVKDLIEGVCTECFKKRRSLFEIPQVVKIIRCPKCGSYFFRGNWEEIEYEEALLRCVKENISVFSELENEEIEVEIREITEGRTKIIVRLSGVLKGEEVEEEKLTEIRISKMQCEMCSRISGGYYEGVIQIRAEGRRAEEEEVRDVVETIYSLVERAAEKRDKKAFITKIERRKDGTNVYLGSKKLGKQICKKLVEEYGGSFTEAPELVGRENGAEKYRVTYSFRLPRFKKGDVIELWNRVFVVLSRKRGYKCLDLESGEEIICSEESIERAKYISSVSSAPKTVVTYVRGDEMEVLHPISYSPIILQRPSFVDERTKEIRVIVHSDRIYPLPEWF